MKFKVFKEEEKETLIKFNSTAAGVDGHVCSVALLKESSALSNSSSNNKLDAKKPANFLEKKSQDEEGAEDSLVGKTDVVNPSSPSALPAQERPQEFAGGQVDNDETKDAVFDREKEKVDLALLSSASASSSSVSSAVQNALPSPPSPSKRPFDATPSQKSLSMGGKAKLAVYIDPSNKENWDSQTGVYSTERQTKKHRLFSAKKDGRTPLADITASFHKKALKATASLQQVAVFIWIVSDSSFTFSFALLHHRTPLIPIPKTTITSHHLPRPFPFL